MAKLSNLCSLGTGNQPKIEPAESTLYDSKPRRGPVLNDALSKFYLFDIGVKRALETSLHSAPVAGTSYYGELFEHFVILEFVRMNLYCETDYRLSYFATKEGIEVDLVLSRGNETIFVEIKSSSSIDPVEVRKLGVAAKGVAERCFYLSECIAAEFVEGVRCLHWRQGLQEIFSPVHPKDPN